MYCGDLTESKNFDYPKIERGFAKCRCKKLKKLR